MTKIGIVTDSNSGITQKRGEELGIYVRPMPFFINEEIFLEDITLSQVEFFNRLGEDTDIKTSQPSPADMMECWDRVLDSCDELVFIPMSGGLSGTCQTAMVLANEPLQSP